MRKSPGVNPHSYVNPQHVKTLFLLIGLVLTGYIIGVRQSDIRSFVINPLSAIKQNRANTISAKELHSMLAKKNPVPSGVEGFTFINVHTPYEGEIEKTDAFIPYDQIVANAGSLPKDKNAAIILYCKTGRMSAEAVETVRKLGYTNVKHLAGGIEAWQKSGAAVMNLSSLENEVLPREGTELPISWGDIGPRLMALGAIDEEKFKKAVKLTPEQEEILTKGSDAKIRIDAQNGQFVVDMLWALGLAQKSVVYEEGPMGQEYKKDAGNFASTGGWTLARGNAMSYLNKFELIRLSLEQQQKVAEIAKNVYRPCCGNSTWFPDCNHGMAALSAIELMVAAGIDEALIYKNILALNSFWFPDTYLTIATYFARQGTSWGQVDAKTTLGLEYSSAKGAQAITKKVGPLPYKPQQGGSCGA